jgi:hypothetical protein
MLYRRCLRNCCRHSLSKVRMIYTDKRCVHSVLTPFMQAFGSDKEPFGHLSRLNLMWARVASSNGNVDVPRTSLMYIFKQIGSLVVYVYNHPCGPGRSDVFDISRYSYRHHKTKLRGFSPRANHTDRAAAAGRRS